MKRLFPYMRLASVIYWGLGIFVWVITSIGFVYLEIEAVRSVQVAASLGYPITADHYATAILLPCVPAFLGFMLGLGVLVSSDLLKLLIRVEENTRMTQLVLRQRKDGTLRPVSDYSMPAPTVWEDESKKVLSRLDQQLPKQSVANWQRPPVPDPKKWER